MEIHQFIEQMPKVELHIHLEGATEPETVLRLAQKHNQRLPADDVPGLRRWFAFSDFSHFINVYMAIQNLMQDKEDFISIVEAFAANRAAQNIRYSEVTVTPYIHVWQEKGITAEMIFNGLEEGRRIAKERYNVEMRWVPDIPRNLPEPAASWTAKTAIAWHEAGAAVALGLGGDERGAPPELFTDAFQEALRHGLHSAPHAGETMGPESIWGALQSLGAQRIGHGVRAIEDPGLLQYLKAAQVPLELNMTSNIRLGLYPEISQHPFPHLFRMGLMVTVNSDDPPLFNTSLTNEYKILVDVFGFTQEEIEQVALNAIQSAFLEADEKRALQKAFRAEFTRLSNAPGETQP